jgi:hypothetical protein
VSVETFSHETLDPLYVTGFVEAAGSFTYSRSGRQMALYFGIKLHDTDRPLLESFQSFFGGIGRLYEVSGRTRSTYYRVSHREELPRIVSHFDSFPLRSSKRRAYETWRSMVLAKQDFRKPDRETLETLAARISKRR